MTSRHVALVTAAAARELDEDLAPLESALREAGADVAAVDWDDAGADWSCFDLAVLRSPWDYTQRLPEFLAWAERTASATRLVNPLPVIRWNTDKHYLCDLEKSGVAIVPSTFVEPGEDAQNALNGFLDAHTGNGPLPPSASFPACEGRKGMEFVVKPAIGAGSRDAQRHHASEHEAAVAHVRRLLDARRSVLLQPYLDRVDEHGETALIFFDGKFSHAIRKGPLLRRGEGPTRALFAAEHIAPREPGMSERTLAERALAAIPCGKPLLYARVDLIQDADGTPRLLELELTEPSLFFDHAPGSASRFAQAILHRAT
jgi:O-ureido-D-serine cyclo-ligase